MLSDELLQPGQLLPVQGPEGEDLGVYSIKGLHAQGGQGYVYELLAPNGSPAALKVPNPQGLISAEVERRILASLPPHPNVIRLLGTTELQGVSCAIFGWAFQNPFLRLNAPYHRAVTRRFRGIAPRTPLPASIAIELVQEVLAALEHMHHHSFVHGDLKPANVLVQFGTNETRLGNRPYFEGLQQRAFRTVLADFGSTRSLSFLQDKGELGNQLAPDEYTPIFAPPEAFGGPSRKRSGLFVDVYQAGLLLYELFTGYVPYEHRLPQVARSGLTPELIDLKRAEGQGRVKAYAPDHLRAARHQDTVFAEAFSSQRLRDRFYEDVEALIEMATHPDPDQRPSIASLRSEMLRRFEMDTPDRPWPDEKPQVSVWNPRWHLTHVNRLALAAKVPDPLLSELAEVDPFGVTEPVKAQGGRSPDAARRGPNTAKMVPGEDLDPDAEALRRRTLRQDKRKQSSTQRLKHHMLSEALSRLPTPRRAPPPTPPRPPKKDAPDYLEMAPADPEPSEEEVPTRDLLEGLRVAVIDDDRVVLAIVGRALQARGCVVRKFLDPEAALEALCRDMPDLAIVDMQMPGLDGLGLIRELTWRLGGQPFPLVVLSSVEDEEVLKTAFRLGVRDYMVKPVAETELAVKLERALVEHAEEVPPVPRELSGYELLDVVRSGELAVVYEAQDAWGRGSGPHWVKVLRPDLAGDPEPLLKLRREIDLISGCDHPGVVRPLETGIEGRLLYFVTDAFPVRSLAREVREDGTLSPLQLLDMLREAAQILEHLHQQAVLVGDLTPESLGRGPDGRLLLSELGRARWLLPVRRHDEVPLPRTRYAAPEVFEGEEDRIDFLADLYALGVCALEVYSGKPALRRRDSRTIDVQTLGTGLPAPLLDLLNRLVSPQPGGRPSSAAELLGLLRRIRA